ncbi:DNA-processing protein DprA [Desulfurivibrio sp. D14AmB]|uniref:DNA-processing protein DprA n=1 Tax=Desulfurivibrio sp. D14AmB TaxID=3374370 RepID=UPI00376EF814
MTTEPDQHLLAWLTLAHTPGLGLTGAHRLLGHYGGVEAILSAEARELQTRTGLRAAAAQALARQTARPKAQKELARVRRSGYHCLPWDDPAYPALLREISDPPLVLYGRGDLQALAPGGMAVVGARAATVYGQKIAAGMAAGLVAAGFTVVSGGALGIDSAAHQGALGVKGGRTVAVLGCGLDIVYPPQNGKLFAEIARNGLLLSEYPPETPPEPFRFPARNRIISGISSGCVVIEAARRSGSLITAELALEQGREVFAVPGRVDTGKSEGCHRLIQEGAKLVHRVEDILGEMAASPLAAGGETPPATGRPDDSPVGEEERQLLAALDAYPRNIEEIIAACPLPAHRINALLLELELQGRVESSPGPQYRLNG